MEMIKVNSSNVIAIGYDGKDLHVQYAGGTYVYENVSRQLFEDLKKAESKGKFMNEFVKGTYKYHRLVESK